MENNRIILFICIVILFQSTIRSIGAYYQHQAIVAKLERIEHALGIQPSK